jgi:hypothetical protein
VLLQPHKDQPHKDQQSRQYRDLSITQDLVYKTRTSVDFAQSRLTGYGKMCNVDLGLLVVTDHESGNRPHPLTNIRRTRRPL